MVIATGTGWPARRLRTMMSSASGNCAPNFFCRRPRRKRSTRQRQRASRKNSDGTGAIDQIAEAPGRQRVSTDRDHAAMTISELADAERQARLQDQPVERFEPAAGNRRRWSARARAATGPARSRGRAGP